MLKTEQQQQQHVYYRLSAWLLVKRARDEFTFGWNEDLAELNGGKCNSAANIVMWLPGRGLTEMN